LSTDDVFPRKYVVYHDIVWRDLYISSDEGKNWQRVTDIPQGDAALFIEHPFNNRMVSVSPLYVPELLGCFWLRLRITRILHFYSRLALRHRCIFCRVIPH
jgi:hypothetical protein